MTRAPQARAGKTRTPGEIRLAWAALLARDDLRKTVLPGLNELGGLVADRRDAVHLAARIHRAACAAANTLRLALKGRGNGGRP